MSTACEQRAALPIQGVRVKPQAFVTRRIVTVLMRYFLRYFERAVSVGLQKEIYIYIFISIKT